MAWQLVLPRTNDPRERKAKTITSCITYPWKTHTQDPTWYTGKPCPVQTGLPGVWDRDEDHQGHFGGWLPWPLRVSWLAVQHPCPAVTASVSEAAATGAPRHTPQPSLQTTFEYCVFSKPAPPASYGFCWLLPLVLLKITRLVSVVCNWEP